MISLSNTLKAWNTDAFTQVFKQEVSSLNTHLLPLQQGLSFSSYVSNEKISALIIKSHETDVHIVIHSGIFYSGIIAGCSCSDDPTPLDTQTEHCELMFNIDKNTGITVVNLIPE